jgi:hypothetical protein
VAVERLPFFANDLPEPLANDRTIHVVVVSPPFVASVVRRIDLDALHLPRVVGEQRFQRDEIVALNDQIAVARLTAGEVRHVL